MESDLHTSTKRVMVEAGSMETKRRPGNRLLTLSTHLIQLLWPSDRVILGVRVCRMLHECLVAVPKLHVTIDPIRATQSSANALLQHLDKSGRLLRDGWNIELFLEKFTSKDISVTMKDERNTFRQSVRGCTFVDRSASRQATIGAEGLRPLAAYLATLNKKVMRLDLDMANHVAYPLITGDLALCAQPQLLQHLHLHQIHWFDMPPTLGAFSALQSLSLAGCTLHEEILTAWQDILPRISDLQHLDVSYTRSFHWNPAQELGEALGSCVCCCTSLTYLDLSGFDVFDSVAAGLRSLHQLRSLHLRHTWGEDSAFFHDKTIPDTLLSSIALLTNLSELSVVVSPDADTNVQGQLEAMSRWPMLSALALAPSENCADGSDFWAATLCALAVQTALASLSLGAASAHSTPAATLDLPAHFHALARFLRCCPRIRRLGIHNALLSASNCAILGPTLRRCPHLTSLDFSAAADLSIKFKGPDAAPGSLALALGLGCAVTLLASLNLAGAQTLRTITPMPLPEPLDRLSDSKSHVEVDDSSRRVSLAEGSGSELLSRSLSWAARFSALAASCTQLSALFLARNLLDDSAAGALASALARCPTLTCLDLADNAITCVGAAALADAMETEGGWGRLERLDVSGNQIQGAGLRRLAGAVGRCAGMEHVLLQKQCGGSRRVGAVDSEAVDWVRSDNVEEELGVTCAHAARAAQRAGAQAQAGEGEGRVRSEWVAMARSHPSLRYFAIDSGTRTRGNRFLDFHRPYLDSDLR